MIMLATFATLGRNPAMVPSFLATVATLGMNPAMVPSFLGTFFCRMLFIEDPTAFPITIAEKMLSESEVLLEGRLRKWKKEGAFFDSGEGVGSAFW